jgi:hypothetical protein
MGSLQRDYDLAIVLQKCSSLIVKQGDRIYQLERRIEKLEQLTKRNDMGLH